MPVRQSPRRPEPPKQPKRKQRRKKRGRAGLGGGKRVHGVRVAGGERRGKLRTALRHRGALPGSSLPPNYVDDPVLGSRKEEKATQARLHVRMFEKEESAAVTVLRQ